MKQHLRFIKDSLLVATLGIASSIVASSPSQAATFALSAGALQFTNFSQSPVGTRTVTNTNAIAIAQEGMVRAQANALATFIVAPPKASNFSISTAFGQGRDYLGLAESTAAVIGSFVVNANTTFAFDFSAALNLNTSIDNPPAENATASGDISFALVDTANNSILDFFSLVGNLTTTGDNDFIAFQESENVTLNNLVSTPNFGGNQESVTASVQGSLQRSFANQTNLTLVEVKRNQVRVTAPEPSTSLALLFCCGVIGVALKGRRKATKSSSFVEIKVTAEV